MYLKSLLIFLFINVNLTLYGQKPEDFTGFWTYEAIVVNSQNDSTKYKLVENLYSNLHIHFKADGQYSSFILNRNENGEWKFLKDILELRSSQGAIIEMKIIEVSDRVLTLKFANETFQLKRNNHNPNMISQSEHLDACPKAEKKDQKKRKKRRKKAKKESSNK